MKYTNLVAFEKHVRDAGEHLAPVYLIAVKDPFISQRAVQRLTNAALAGENRDQCLTECIGDSVSSEMILNELHGASLFAKKSVVLIHQGDSLKKPVMEALQKYFAKPNRTSTLVIVAETFSANSNFYKSAEKVGVILQVGAEKSWEKEKVAKEWLQMKALAVGKVFGAGVVDAMVRQCGPELSVLDSEADKLFCYIGDRLSVTRQDVAAICVVNESDTIWQLGEAIFQRNGAVVMRVGRVLLSQESLLGLLAQLRRQFETDYQICSILANGGGHEQITKAFPYMTGTILEKHISMAQGYGAEGFKKGLLLIQQVELAAKNSSADTELLGEMLLARLVTPPVAL